MDSKESAEIAEAVRLAWLEYRLTDHASDKFRYENAQRTHERKMGNTWVPLDDDWQAFYRLQDERKARRKDVSARNRAERDHKREAAKALDQLPPHPALGKGLFA